LELNWQENNLIRAILFFPFFFLVLFPFDGPGGQVRSGSKSAKKFCRSGLSDLAGPDLALHLDYRADLSLDKS
jgi:hypothetical protein